MPFKGELRGIQPITQEPYIEPYTLGGTDIDIYSHGNHSVGPRKMIEAAQNLWLPGAVVTGFETQFRGELLAGKTIITTNAFDLAPGKRVFEQEMSNPGAPGVKQTLNTQVLETGKTLSDLPRLLTPPNAPPFVFDDRNVVIEKQDGDLNSDEIIPVFEDQRFKMLLSKGINLVDLMNKGLYVVVTNLKYEPRAQIPANTEVTVSNTLYFDTAKTAVFKQVVVARGIPGEITQLTRAMCMRRDENGKPGFVRFPDELKRQTQGLS